MGKGYKEIEKIKGGPLGNSKAEETPLHHPWQKNERQVCGAGRVLRRRSTELGGGGKPSLGKKAPNIKNGGKRTGGPWGLVKTRVGVHKKTILLLGGNIQSRKNLTGERQPLNWERKGPNKKQGYKAKILTQPHTKKKTKGQEQKTKHGEDKNAIKTR